MTPQRLFDFLPLAVQSLTQPRVGLRTILSLPVERVDVINAAWLVIVLNLLLTVTVTLIGPVPPEGTPVIPITTHAVMQTLSLFGGAIMMHRVGAMFGGTGSFDNSLKLVIWVNFILFLLQIPMLFAAAGGPEIIALVMMLVVIVGMTQLTAQVMELHGFTEVFPVLLGIIASMFAFAIVLLILLGLLGVTLPTIEPPA